MKTTTLGEMAATDRREWVQDAIQSCRRYGMKNNAVIPIVPNLHRQILTAIENGGSLDMALWHTCGTTHCYAGWTTHLSGKLGLALENCLSYITVAEAAWLIIAASCPHVKKCPNFDGEIPERQALATIRRYAAMEGK